MLKFTDIKVTIIKKREKFLMKKILVVETNQATYRRRSEATGLWLGETTEFVLAVQAAGYQVDYVSPKGGYVPLDPRSMKYADQASMELYQRPSFQQMALAHTLSSSRC